jgi:hypothetical protein
MIRDGIGRFVLLMGMLMLAVPAVAQDFSGRLGRVPVDSRNQASIAGSGSMTAELDGRWLVVTGNFADMLGAATIANLHIGIAVGARGPVIGALTVSPAAAGDVSGRLELNRDQLAALRAGRLYVQVHSESAPDGNLWGWLLSE